MSNVWHRTPWTAGLSPLLGIAFLLAAGLTAGAQPAPEQLESLPGFKIDLVLKADKKANGSWINMARDPKGRLLLGGQRGQPVTRVTLADGKVVKQEDLKLPISETMGLLWAFDSLYVNGSGKTPEGKTVYGMWRLRPTADGDSFGAPELLREWKGGSGEHGAHGIVLGPDKKLYVVCGNFVGVPEDLLPSSPHRNYADDLILPRAEDGNGFGAGKRPPGGYIVRLDENGKNAELFASGQRNTYDIAFNPDGELLGYDSDMEWDWGTPWYRPTRVFHATSGADHGFREGTAKWPEYYADSLPATVNIGIGCPTGVMFGAGARFPAKYQKAMFILDWSYGRLIAVHLTPQGSGYTATWENFVAPKSLKMQEGKTPLNLTDVVIGADGALYFTIGGRNTGSALYRVAYAGNESTAPADLHDEAGAKEREQRHRLEAFHGHPDPAAVSAAWAYLGSEDRFLRHAARIAVESQPVGEWKSRALAETKPEIALTALLSLARYGGTEAQADVFRALARLPIGSLDAERQLEKLRVIEVAVARTGKPSADLAKPIVDELTPLYPAQSPAMNRELCQVLLAFGAPGTVEKTVKLLKEAKTQEEQVLYVHHLRTITDGWTPDARRAYFSWWMQDRSKLGHWPEVVRWFQEAGIRYNDGASFPKFLANFHKDAEKTLKPDEVAALQPLLSAYVPPTAKPRRPARKHEFVKTWKMADLEPALAQVSKGRNYNRGKEAFEAAQCVLCHKFGSEGGAVGPDLTAVSTRFSRRDVLESIVEPSKVVSEQYQNTILELADGDQVDGRVLEENNDRVIIQVNPLQPEKLEVKRSEIKGRRASKLSPMPANLVDVLKQEEILDLMAYLESGGRKDAPMFAK